MVLDGEAVNKSHGSWKVWFLGPQELDPQSGHVSNLCGPTGIVIEPINPDSFQKGRR